MEGLKMTAIMPNVEHLKYLIDIWFDVGPCVDEGPVPYSELNFYPAGLTIFEQQAVRAMSKSYISGLRSGENNCATWPYKFHKTQTGADAISNKIKGLFK